MIEQKVVALVYKDGELYDECYTWEAGQNYAMHEGLNVKAIADDGFMTVLDAQAMYDVELNAYNDCWGK